MNSTVTFEQVEDEEQREKAGLLIREYLGWLNIELKQRYNIEFDIEAMVHSDLSDQVKFHPPYGRFYLARYNNQIAGVGCLKKLETDVAEVQRMYVPPAHRGKGIGRAIINRLIDDARSIGYHRLRLESLNFLNEAHSLYHSVGFREINSYADNSMTSYQPTEQLDVYFSVSVYMEMDLLTDSNPK